MFDSNGAGLGINDLDNEGDLDIVVNNLLTPAQLFENRLCGGQALEVDLFWPGNKNTREIRSASGYLSGDPARVHFGFPQGSQLERLAIRWPDGTMSEITGAIPSSLLTLMHD